jgi:hypothetical protein
MRRIFGGSTILGLAALLLLAACGGGGGEAAEAARQVELDALRQAKVALDAKRAELSALRDQRAQAASASGEGEPAADPAALEAQVNALDEEVIAMSDDLTGRLVAFINANAPLVGEPMTESFAAALHMKSDEDILLAQGYVNEGGDYARAIRIYEDALKADPDYPALQQALAGAVALRYMTPERFAEAKKGMTAAEVRATLGQVNLRNIREYPDRDVIAWFYPSGEDGSAAGVFFRRERRSGDYVVYQTNFEAVKPRGDGTLAESE